MQPDRLGKRFRLNVNEGDPHWIQRRMIAFQSVANDASADLVEILEPLDAIVKHQGWNSWPENEPYGSLEVMCLDLTGMKFSDLVRMVRSRATDIEDSGAKAEPAAKPSETGRGKTQDSVRSSYGNSRAHTIRRLARDAETEPKAADALERVLTREISAAEARRRVYPPPSPPDADRHAAHLMKKHGHDWCQELVDALRKGLSDG